jgi:hypothetical protein
MENLYADPIIKEFLKPFLPEQWEFVLRTLVVYSIRGIKDVYAPKGQASVYELETFCNYHQQTIQSFNKEFRDLCGQLHHFDKKMITLLKKAEMQEKPCFSQKQKQESTSYEKTRDRTSKSREGLPIKIKGKKQIMPCKTPVERADSIREQCVNHEKENKEFFSKKRKSSFDSGTQAPYLDLGK